MWGRNGHNPRVRVLLLAEEAVEAKVDPMEMIRGKEALKLRTILNDTVVEHTLIRFHDLVVL
eukprot:scaffold5568_cov50-Cyclotella_meneghiniana.AAC.1